MGAKGGANADVAELMRISAQGGGGRVGGSLCASDNKNWRNFWSLPNILPFSYFNHECI